MAFIDFWLSLLITVGSINQVSVPYSDNIVIILLYTVELVLGGYGS